MIPIALKIFFGLSLIWAIGFAVLSQYLIGALRRETAVVDAVFFSIAVMGYVAVLLTDWLIVGPAWRGTNR